MDVKSFLMQMPYLCRAKNASRWSRLIELQYDDEFSYQNSVFARNAEDVENPGNRMETMFGFVGDVGRIAHCRKLVAIIGLTHYRTKHNEAQWDDLIKELVSSALESEPSYPDIAASMSVESAQASDDWNG